MGDISWLWGSWYASVPAPWLHLILALVAVFCGLLVGGERQRREKAAGLRTLALVCLGSATFTMTSFAFTTTTGDSGRVSAQIVTGIGFLGAGVILHGQRRISGMTTAAIIWVTAAIGMAIGAGYVLAGIAVSILANRLLVGIFLYETRWHPDLHEACVNIEYVDKGGVTRVKIERILVEYDVYGVTSDWMQVNDETGELSLTVRLARVHLYELLSEISDIPGILSIRQESCTALRPKTSS